MILAPDDFRNNPYLAGLNQIGHGGLAAAVMIELTPWLGLAWSTGLTGLAILALEVWQLWSLGAFRSDYWADLSFWFYGLILWPWFHFWTGLFVLGGLWMFYMGKRQ